MQLLSKFNEGELVFVCILIKNDRAWLSGPVKIEKVDLRSRRIEKTTAWDVNYFYKCEPWADFSQRKIFFARLKKLIVL